jgi:serine/threonine protein kinase
VLNYVLTERRTNKLQLGENAQTGEVVVLKWRIDGRRESFARELRMLKRLSGVRGVVRLIDYAEGGRDLNGQQHGGVLILEYLRASSARHICKFPSEEALKDYFRQLLQALLECERRSVVHHDLNEGNVVLTEDLRVVLIDFDHAAVTPCLAYQPCTPGHTPPGLEWHPGSGPIFIDSSIDVWGVGIMLFEALIGLLPYTDELGWGLGALLAKAQPGRLREEFLQWHSEVVAKAGGDELKAFYMATDEPWTKPGPWCSEEGLELVRCLLAQDPKWRLTLAGALRHPYLSSSEGEDSD